MTIYTISSAFFVLIGLVGVLFGILIIVNPMGEEGPASFVIALLGLTCFIIGLYGLGII